MSNAATVIRPGKEPASPDTAVPIGLGEDFRLERYFLGETYASGLFQDFTGRVRRQFGVDLTGTMDGETLILDERFVYDDGERQRRVWRVTPEGQHGYAGTAEDVRGIARGTAAGRTFSWRYKVGLRINGKVWTVDFDDRFWLQPDGLLMNRAVVRKFGFAIGAATIVFTKDRPAGAV